MKELLSSVLMEDEVLDDYAQEDDDDIDDGMAVE
jgi:hypothetical protein